MNESIIRILKNSLAKSTQKSYHNTFKHFLRFHDTYYTGQAMLPISTHKLAQFISVCHDLGLQPNSITSMVSALSYIHRLYDFPNPAHTFLIQKMLYSIRKQRVSDQRLGFSLNLLQKLIQSLSLITHDTYITLLLRTMFLLAFYALLRVSEITTTSNGSANIINRENVKFSYKNGKVIKASLKLMNYKHSKGQTSTIILSRAKNRLLCPVRVLSKYCSVTTHKSGPLFQFSCGKTVTASYFRRLLKRCVEHCHLDPTKYTSHSFRIGGATLAHDRNFSESQIQKLGRWSSNAYTKYLRPSLNPTPVT